MKVKHYIGETKKYIAERSELFVGIGVVGGLVLIIAVIVLVTQLNGPHVVYQPTKACDLLTPVKAEDLLGDKVYSTDTNEPKITGNVATSKCSYTDQNANGMKIAAVAVRSGINDEGDAQNKADFATKAKMSNMQTVTNLGSSAFFDPATGQLNVLSGHRWLILNFGLADSPQGNNLEDDIALAHKVM